MQEKESIKFLFNWSGMPSALIGLLHALILYLAIS